MIHIQSPFANRLCATASRYLAMNLAILTGIALGAAVGAQYLLDKNKSLGLAAAGYGLAALLFVLLYRKQALEGEEPGPSAPKRRLRWLLVVLAAGCGALAFPRFKGNLFHADATALWLLGLVLLGVVAWTPRPKTNTPADGQPDERILSLRGLRLTWHHLALLGIILVGAFYRLYRIDLIPQEMGPDLPHNYNNIRTLLRSEFLIFFPSYPGRESLFFYLAAIFCRFFGLSHVTIKISAALISVFTLPLIYLLGKELFNREVGLWSAFFLSLSHWHIILCRVGYRASTLPPIVILIWYFLVRGLKTQRRWFFALSGLFFGLGFYTYNAFMIAPLFVLLILLSNLLVGRGRRLLTNWDNVLLLVLVALYVLIPLGRYAYEQPQAYLFRASTRITGVEAPLPSDVIKTLWTTTTRALLMFNYRGDMLFISNVPFMRELGFFTAVFFVLGFAYALWRWRHGYMQTVLIVLIVMLLPTMLALAFPQEVPSAIRAIGALPAVALFPALSLTLVRRRLAALFPARPVREVHLAFDAGDAKWELRWRWPFQVRHALLLVLVFILAAETWAVYPIYFRDYVTHLPAKNYSISLELARAIDSFADDGVAYIKAIPYWYDGNAVRAQLRRTDQNWHKEMDTLPPDQPPLVGPHGKYMVIVNPQDQPSLQALRAAFPRWIETTHMDYDNKVAFITFYGER
jgi:4-amino-4-deoxy-L-arabinose transferase-like glycosyltransferase